MGQVASGERRKSAVGGARTVLPLVPRLSSNHMRTAAPEWEPTWTRCLQRWWEGWTQKCVTFLIQAVLFSFSLHERKDPRKVRTGWVVNCHAVRGCGCSLEQALCDFFLVGVLSWSSQSFFCLASCVAGPHQTLENVYNFLLIEYLSVHFSINTVCSTCWPDLPCPTPSKYLSTALKFDRDKVTEGIFNLYVFLVTYSEAKNQSLIQPLPTLACTFPENAK